MDYRKTGEHCALRGVVNNQVWLAQAMVVVKDGPDETILLLLPGAQCAFPEIWYWQTKKDMPHRSRWQEARSEHIALQEFNWTATRALMFLEPEKYYSCALFWNHASDQFSCYYINFQLPYSRSHCGFDTFDLSLDIIVDPRGNWHWKDADIYQQGIEEGGLEHAWVQAIEQSKAEVLERIRQRSYPLDDSWLSWRPDPAWLIPALPENWKAV